MALDWITIWGVVGPAVAGLAMYLKTRKPRQAELDAAVAGARAETSIASATETQYRGLREDLDMLRRDITALRAELDVERKHGRKLEKHIWLLEGLMRKNGIEPPAFSDAEPTT